MSPFKKTKSGIKPTGLGNLMALGGGGAIVVQVLKQKWRQKKRS